MCLLAADAGCVRPNQDLKFLCVLDKQSNSVEIIIMNVKHFRSFTDLEKAIHTLSS